MNLLQVRSFFERAIQGDAVSSAANIPSLLLVEEYFEREDGRFLPTIRNPFPPAPLQSFAQKWRADPRPWARQQILAYLDLPLNCAGHNPLVKRLFKHAETISDHELMGAFLVAFDRLIRRVRKTRSHWDWNPQTRKSSMWTEEVLKQPRDVISLPRVHKARNPRTGQPIEVPVPSVTPKLGKLFSFRTRKYLRRRVWRYFRRLGYQKPGEYIPAVAAALCRYRDDDLNTGENLLDSWSLLHACFHESPVLEFRPSAVELKGSLADLKAAPRFQKLWQAPEAVLPLLDLLIDAQSRCVRNWAHQLLEQYHRPRLESLSVEVLLKLLEHDDEEVQQFGAELLSRIQGIERWPISTWLKLLETRNHGALAVICEAMKKTVARQRLSLPQILEIATAQATPVARLGLDLLRQREITTAEDRQLLAAAGKAQCAATGEELARLVLNLVGREESYEPDVVLSLFDSLLRELRVAALDWLRESKAGQQDSVLWCRLLETPFDELRLGLIDMLQRRSTLPGVNREDLTPVWTSVLLGVHRGGRQKPKAVQQVAQAIMDKPELADRLLPVLSAAVRSIRGPEVRAGLAAFATILDQRPELAGSIRKFVPEFAEEALV